MWTARFPYPPEATPGLAPRSRPPQRWGGLSFTDPALVAHKPASGQRVNCQQKTISPNTITSRPVVHRLYGLFPAPAEWCTARSTRRFFDNLAIFLSHGAGGVRPSGMRQVFRNHRLAWSVAVVLAMATALQSWMLWIAIRQLEESNGLMRMALRQLEIIQDIRPESTGSHSTPPSGSYPTPGTGPIGSD